MIKPREKKVLRDALSHFYRKNIQVRSTRAEKNFEFEKHFSVEAIDKVYFSHNTNNDNNSNEFVLFARFNHRAIKNPLYIEIYYFLDESDCFYKIFVSQNYNLIKALSDFDYPNSSSSITNINREEIFQSIWKNELDEDRLLLDKKLHGEYENFVRARYTYDSKPDCL